MRSAKVDYRHFIMESFRLLEADKWYVSVDYGRVLEGDERIVVIGLMNGAVMFTADLARSLTVANEIDFIRVSSYHGTNSTGNVRCDNVEMESCPDCTLGETCESCRGHASRPSRPVAGGPYRHGNDLAMGQITPLRLWREVHQDRLPS